MEKKSVAINAVVRLIFSFLVFLGILAFITGSLIKEGEKERKIARKICTEGFLYDSFRSHRGLRVPSGLGVEISRHLMFYFISDRGL